MSASLYNLDYEKNLVAGVLQYPDLYPELSLLTAKDFSRTNSTIWELLSKTIECAEVPTPLLLAEKLKSVGVTLEIDAFAYLESLRYLPIDKKGVPEVAKSVRKLSLIRNVIANADKLKSRVLELKDSPASEIWQALDETMGDSIMMVDSQGGDAMNLYDGLGQFIEQQGNDQVQRGYKMPFTLWHENFGILKKKNIYNIISRSGHGKSTLLSFVGDSVANDCNPGMDIKVLFLDTEMDEADQRIRIVAARTGCPYYLIDTGLWRNDEEWLPKMRTGLKKLESQKRNMWFKQVASMGINDLCNFIKRWFYKNVGKGGNALIVYDYMKVLANDRGKNNRASEWELAGDKMQKLKDVITEIDAPLMTAVQATRAGTTTNRESSEVVDDETIAAISGRLDWLVAFNGIFRRKTHDEILLHGKEFGTHSLIRLKGRYQGRISQGHHDLVKIIEKNKPKYKENFLCFDIDNFKVEETGDFRGIAKLKGWTKLKKEDGSEKRELL